MDSLVALLSQWGIPLLVLVGVAAANLVPHFLLPAEYTRSERAVSQVDDKQLTD